MKRLTCGRVAWQSSFNNFAKAFLSQNTSQVALCKVLVKWPKLTADWLVSFNSCDWVIGRCLPQGTSTCRQWKIACCFSHSEPKSPNTHSPHGPLSSQRSQVKNGLCVHHVRQQTRTTLLMAISCCMLAQYCLSCAVRSKLHSPASSAADSDRLCENNTTTKSACDVLMVLMSVKRRKRKTIREEGTNFTS